MKDLKVTENSSNETFANVCVQSVIEAHLPPIPEDVANTLPPEGLGSGWTRLHYFSEPMIVACDNYRNPGNRE